MIMKVSMFFFSSLVTVVLAQPGQFPPPGNEYQAPGQDDIRGPCPAINTLANHGFIARDGINVPVQDLANALELVYRVSADTLIGGPIASAIRLGLTNGGDTSDDATLTIDRLSNGIGGNGVETNAEDDEGQEHDSSFVREDFNNPNGVDTDLASPRLIAEFFESTKRAIIKPDEVMEYQRRRIKESCETTGSRKPREYTGAMRGGMAIQASLLFALSQSQGQNFNHINKSKLRSILEGEELPDNYNPGTRPFLHTFDEDRPDALRDEFRASVEAAICDFCDGVATCN